MAPCGGLISPPGVSEEIHDDFREQTNCTVEAVEAIILSSKGFFKERSAVANHMHKVPYLETESDKVTTRLRKYIFKQEKLHQSHWMLHRDFVSLQAQNSFINSNWIKP